MYPYINMHTHHASPGHGVFLFNNRWGDTVFRTESLFSVGVHPWDAASLGPDYPAGLAAWLKHPNCFALGECGLDKVRGPDIRIQERVFVEQLALAVNAEKPVVIHCVKAFDELLSICAPYEGKIPLVIHGFRKSVQLAEQLIGKGFYLSLHPALVLQDGFDLRRIPSHRLFFETDMAEDVTIEAIYNAAAQRLRVGEDQLKERINANFEGLNKR